MYTLLVIKVINSGRNFSYNKKNIITTELYYISLAFQKINLCIEFKISNSFFT